MSVCFLLLWCLSVNKVARVLRHKMNYFTKCVENCFRLSQNAPPGVPQDLSTAKSRTR